MATEGAAEGVAVYFGTKKCICLGEHGVVAVMAPAFSGPAGWTQCTKLRRRLVL